MNRRHLLTALAVSLTLASAPALARKAHHSAAKHAGGSWDGRWAGAWGGRDATAINISGARVVSYEYGGSTNPVSSSRVSGTRVSYATPDGVTVTMSRTGANSAHATLKSGQGNGEAELMRQ
jgi:hypothetical protein